MQTIADAYHHNAWYILVYPRLAFPWFNPWDLLVIIPSRSTRTAANGPGWDMTAHTWSLYFNICVYKYITYALLFLFLSMHILGIHLHICACTSMGMLAWYVEYIWTSRVPLPISIREQPVPSKRLSGRGLLQAGAHRICFRSYVPDMSITCTRGYADVYEGDASGTYRKL